jgi:hypothetical protein
MEGADSYQIAKNCRTSVEMWAIPSQPGEESQVKTHILLILNSLVALRDGQ